MKREEILKTALRLVTKDRQDDYGSAESNMSLAGELIDAYINALDRPLMASDVAMINILQKVARTVFGYKDDNAIDIAGYACLFGELRGDEIAFEKEITQKLMGGLDSKVSEIMSEMEPKSNVVNLKPSDAN